MLVGRMHSLGPDQFRGYTMREIGDHSANWIGGQPHDLGVLDKANDPYRESLRNSGAGGCAYEVYDRSVTKAAIAQIDRLGCDGDQRPFAMTVGWMLPHAPYVCSPVLYDYYATRVLPPNIPVPTREHPHYAWWRNDRGIADATMTEIMRARTAYYGAVETLDGMLGEILQALKTSGLAANTVVIYASDHGDHLGNRGLWWKSTLYDEAAKVPLIIALPPKLGAASRRLQVCGLIDLNATILDLAGAPLLPASQGRSLRPCLADSSTPWINQTFSEYVSDGVPAWSGGRVTVARMIRRERWKLIYHLGLPAQLFDLDADPTEQNDLAGRAEYAGIQQTLTEQVLAGWDPRAIATLQEQRASEHAVLRNWAHNVEPPDVIRWPMLGEQNWLRDSPAPRADPPFN